jgi:glucose-6-phosphate dehydrogenase assembly protein OpcA
MATTYKVLGQINPAATSLTTLYTVPASTSTVVSTLMVCNQAGSSASFRVAIRPAGASIVASHYLSYDTAIPANDSIALTLGITLATTDVVSVYASTSTMSFNLFGSELT